MNYVHSRQLTVTNRIVMILLRSGRFIITSALEHTSTHTDRGAHTDAHAKINSSTHTYTPIT